MWKGGDSMSFRVTTNGYDDTIFQIDNEKFCMSLFPDKFFPCLQKHINLFNKILKMTTFKHYEYLYSLKCIINYLDDQIINECNTKRLNKLKSNYKTFTEIYKKELTQ